MTLISRFDRASRCLLPLIVVFTGAFDRGATAAGASPCPDNQIILTGVNVVSNKAALDTAWYLAHGSYGLKSGLLSSNVGVNNTGWISSSVTTDDEYRVFGLPAGTPHDFTATFQVSGSWHVFPGAPQGNFTYECSIAADTDTAGFAQPPGGCCHGDISHGLSISLHRLAQERFHIRLHLASADNSGAVDESGLLMFTGLPPGAVVVSCQGYVSDPTVIAVDPRTATPSALGFADIRPNPTSSALALTTRLPVSAPAGLEVFDLLGRSLVSRELRFVRPGSYPLRIEEARAFPPGVYTLRLAQAGRYSTAIFTVVR
jgi:hypothetical protein